MDLALFLSAGSFVVLLAVLAIVIALSVKMYKLIKRSCAEDKDP